MTDMQLYLIAALVSAACVLTHFRMKQKTSRRRSIILLLIVAGAYIASVVGTHFSHADIGALFIRALLFESICIFILCNL